MINKFMTVYAGHIDIPDHGQNSTPANDRRYTNDELASVFDKTEAIAKELGLKSPFETNQPVSVEYMPGRARVGGEPARVAAE